MQVPLQITFHGVNPAAGIDAVIRERAARLDRFAERITRCRVTLALPHRRHRTGRQYRVHLDIATPLGAIHVTRDPAPDGARQLAAAVREAFDAAARQLEEEMRRRRAA